MRCHCRWVLVRTVAVNSADTYSRLVRLRVSGRRLLRWQLSLLSQRCSYVGKVCLLVLQFSRTWYVVANAENLSTQYAISSEGRS